MSKAAFYRMVEAAVPRHYHMILDDDLGLLQGAGVASIGDLIAVLGDARFEATVRGAACRLLAYVGRYNLGQAVTALAARLDDPDPNLRRWASRALVELDDARGLEALLAAVAHEADPWVLHQQLEHLSYLADLDRAAVVGTYLRVMQHHTYPDVIRSQAMEQLGHLGAAEAIEPLVDYLSHPSVELRFFACFALGLMGDPALIPTLEHVAAHDHELLPGWWLVSEEAADAIKTIRGDPVPERDRRWE